MAWLIAMLPTLALVALLTGAELLWRRERTDWWRNLEA